MKTTNATNYAITVDGDLKSFSEARWQSMLEKLTKEGKEHPAPERVQTFVTYEAETPEDFAVLASATQVDLFNRGSSLKQLQEIRILMESADFEPTETPYDLADVINRETERRSASPEARVEKLLSALDPDALARIMEKLSAAKSRT